MVFPIAPQFNPTCFAQSPHLLTYIGGPKDKALYLSQNLLFWEAPVVSGCFATGQSNWLIAKKRFSPIQVGQRARHSIFSRIFYFGRHLQLQVFFAIGQSNWLIAKKGWINMIQNTAVPFQVRNKLNSFLISRIFWILIVSYDENFKNLCS